MDGNMIQTNLLEGRGARVSVMIHDRVKEGTCGNIRCMYVDPDVENDRGNPQMRYIIEVEPDNSAQSYTGRLIEAWETQFVLLR